MRKAEDAGSFLRDGKKRDKPLEPGKKLDYSATLDTDEEDDIE